MSIWSLLFTQEINVKEETFGISSSSTSIPIYNLRWCRSPPPQTVSPHLPLLASSDRTSPSRTRRPARRSPGRGARRIGQDPRPRSASSSSPRPPGVRRGGRALLRTRRRSRWRARRRRARGGHRRRPQRRGAGWGWALSLASPALSLHPRLPRPRRLPRPLVAFPACPGITAAMRFPVRGIAHVRLPRRRGDQRQWA
jgi:hypothetical protein